MTVFPSKILTFALEMGVVRVEKETNKQTINQNPKIKKQENCLRVMSTFLVLYQKIYVVIYS